MVMLVDFIRSNLLNISDEKYESFNDPKIYNIIYREVDFIIDSIIDCLDYIKNNCLIDPSEFNGGQMYRAALLKDLDKKTLEPLGKAISKNCGSKDDNEAVWFAKKVLPNYIKGRLENLKPDESNYGIISCKKFKDSYEKDDGDIVDLKFINLTDTSQTRKCINKDVHPLNTELQTHFNKCLIIPLLRLYSSKYSYDNPDIEPIPFDDILKNDSINKLNIIDKQVTGYPCGGDGNTTTINNIFKAWNYKDGTRDSYFNEDRLQITVLFQIIDIFNKLLEQKNIKILGWVCDDAPRPSKENCQVFHGELAIAIKYLQTPYRELIFDDNEEECSLSVYKIDGPGLVKVKLADINRGGGIKRKNSEYVDDDDDGVPDMNYSFPSSSRKTPSSSRKTKKQRKYSSNRDDVPDIDRQGKVLPNDDLNNYDYNVDGDDAVVPDIDERIKDIDDFFFFDNLPKIKGGNKKRRRTKRKRTTRKRRVTRKKHNKYRV
jgi:hypothetical protein